MVRVQVHGLYGSVYPVLNDGLPFLPVHQAQLLSIVLPEGDYHPPHGEIMLGELSPHLLPVGDRLSLRSEEAGAARPLGCVFNMTGGGTHGYRIIIVAHPVGLRISPVGLGLGGNVAYVVVIVGHFSGAGLVIGYIDDYYALTHPGHLP